MLEQERFVDSILRWDGMPVSWSHEWQTKKTSLSRNLQKKTLPEPDAYEFTWGEFHSKILYYLQYISS